MKRDFQLPTILGVQPNVSFSRCLYWQATLNSYKYLKSETHLQNAKVNKGFFVNKICLIVDMVRKNCSWIVVAGCGLHYFVVARFGSFWVIANFTTVERFNKHLFSTAMKIHTMKCIVKKQNNFIFISLVT